jgi:hypothetical protein
MSFLLPLTACGQNSELYQNLVRHPRICHPGAMDREWVIPVYLINLKPYQRTITSCKLKVFRNQNLLDRLQLRIRSKSYEKCRNPIKVLFGFSHFAGDQSGSRLVIHTLGESESDSVNK